MARFCSNCGSPMNDGDRVCGNCGMPVEEISDVGSAVLSQAQKGKYIALLVGIAICLLVAVMIVVNVIGNFVGYKGSIRKMVRALQDYDMESLTSLASSIGDEMYTFSGYSDVSDAYQSAVSEILDGYEDNVGIIKKIDYKISEATEFSDRRVEEIKNHLIDSYNIDTNNIDKIMNIEIVLTVKGSKKSASYNVSTLYLIKESGKWKIYYGSLDS